MIKNNQLTYAAASTPWYAWEISSSQYANSFLVAVLVTIISYQVTSLVFDLLLGLKTKKVTRVNAFHILLLAWKSSPLGVLNNVLRRDSLTRFYFQGGIPKGSKIAREEERIQTRTTVRLLILLAVAPIANILSVLMSLERTKELTFSEIGFEGVKLGINKDLSVLDSHTDRSSKCRSFPIQSRSSDSVTFGIQTCVVNFANLAEQNLEMEENYTETSCLRVLSGWRGGIQIDAAVNRKFQRRIYYTELRVGDDYYPLNNTISNVTVFPAVRSVMDVLAKACGYEDADAVQELNSTEIEYPILNMKFASSYTLISCNEMPNSEEVLEKVLDMLEETFTLFPSEGLTFNSDRTSSDFVNVADLIAVRRRESNFGLIPIAITALVVILVRLLSMLFLSNDVVEGMNSMLKTRYGLHECQPMLHAGEKVVQFRRAHQSGTVGHYGLARDDMAPVPKLKSCSVVGGEEYGTLYM